jgi:GTP pyrophosphokinase
VVGTGGVRRRASRTKGTRANASVDDDVYSRMDAASTSGSSTPAAPALQLQLSSGASGSGAFGSSSRVMDFVAAWDAINPRLAEHGEVNKEMLLSALTLAIPRLQQIPMSGGHKESKTGGGKPAHERAVDVTLTLVDLGMDAECISAGLLREAVVHGTVTLDEIEAVLGEGVMKLAHDVGRVHDLPRRVHSYDEESAERLRSFYLSFHDIRAIVVELACRLDVLRHVDEYAPIQRTTLALETMQIYAPMAHALNTGTLCAELEDLAFKILFPTSYASLEQWLASNNPADSAVLDRTSKLMTDAMNSDTTLNALVGRGGVKVLARRKSRYSTMKKIIRDGRKREQVHDLLGMRLILTPQPGSAAEMPDIGEVSAAEDAEARALKAANAACYRAQQIAHSMFPAVSGRTKDYVSNPKPNGYSSLHSTLKVAFDTNGKPLSMSDALKRGANVELQIRTCAMHIAAEAGAASHTSYKGGLKEDTGMVRSLADLATAANRAAEEKFGSFMHSDLRTRCADHDRLFDTFDLDGDGRVTIAELRQVLSKIWNTEEESQLRAEADALMTLLDVNEDGTIDPNEFTKFRASLTAISALPKADAETLAAIEAVALDTEEDVVVEVQTVDVKDAVIDVNVVPTGGKLEDEAELIATVREAVNSSYEYIGKSDAAARKAAAAMRETNPAPIEWQLVWDLMKSGRAETARQLFYQRTTRTPSEIETWEQWARFELLQGDPERARGLYRAALLHCTDMPLVRAETLRKWAMMELASTDALHTTSAPDLFSRAIAVLAEASAEGKITKEESGKGQAKVYHTWSQGASRRGDLAQARTLLDKAEALDANNPAVAHARGQIEEATGNVTAAIAAYAMGAASNPTDPFLIQSWARLEAKAGRLANARALYKRGIEAHPDNHHLAQAWAVSESKHRDGDASIAREQFQRASAIAPWSVHTWAAWARFEAFAENNTRSIETALALYTRGLEVERGNVVCLIGLAECQSRLGRFDAARDVLSIAQRAHPDHWGVVFEMAKLEERAGQPAKAIHHYTQAREMKRMSRARAPSTASRGKTSTWSPLERLERDERDERASRSAAVVSASAVVDALRLDDDDDDDASDFDADASRVDAYATKPPPRRPVVRAQRRRRYVDDDDA